MSEQEVLQSNAKVLSDIAEITVEEATNMLLEVMKTYKLNTEDLNSIVEKFNESKYY